LAEEREKSHTKTQFIHHSHTLFATFVEQEQTTPQTEMLQEQKKELSRLMGTTG
jgi:hypothetical protein